MNGLRDGHTKWGKLDKDNIIWCFLYVESKKKMIQMKNNKLTWLAKGAGGVGVG